MKVASMLSSSRSKRLGCVGLALLTLVVLWSCLPPILDWWVQSKEQEYASNGTPIEFAAFTSHPCDDEGNAALRIVEAYSRIRVPQIPSNSASLESVTSGENQFVVNIFSLAQSSFGAGGRTVDSSHLKHWARQLIYQNADSISLVEEAGNMPLCCFPADYNQAEPSFNDHLVGVERLSWLLAVSATLYSIDGKPEVACDNIATILGLSDRIGDVPSHRAPTAVFRILTIAKLATEQLINADAQPSAEALRRLATEFEKRALDVDLSRMMRFELASQLRFIRFTRHQLYEPSRTNILLRSQYWLYEPFFPVLQLIAISRMADWVQIAGKGCTYVQGQDDFLRSEQQDESIADELGRALGPVNLPLLQEGCKTIALGRTSSIACQEALRSRMNLETSPSLSQYDGSLRLDPFSGDELLLRSNGDCLYVYSVGPNRQDDWASAAGGCEKAAGLGMVGDDIGMRVALGASSA